MNFLQPVHESNDCHAPAGSPAGGEFCAGASFPTQVHGPGARVQLPGRYDTQQVPKGALVVTSPHGYISLGPGRHPGHMWVAHIRVKDEFQGKGEGSHLYTAALAAVHARGLQGIEQGGSGDETRHISDAARRRWAQFERQGRTKTMPDGLKVLVR